MITSLIILAIFIGIMIILDPLPNYIINEVGTYRCLWINWFGKRRYIMLWKIKQDEN